jgi:hypothetical protein
LVKLLLIPTPESHVLINDCDLEPSVTSPTSLNPFFTLPQDAVLADFTNVGAYLGTTKLQAPSHEMDDIIERVRCITGLARPVFRQVLHRQDDQCLVRYLSGFMLCSMNHQHPRLYDVLNLYIQKSDYYRIVNPIDGAIDQKPKAFSKSKEKPAQQTEKIMALIRALGITPTELGFLHSIPSPPRSDTDGEPISRMGGFTILTTYGIRYSSQNPVGSTPWSSPYPEATQYNSIPKWYLLSEGLERVLGCTRRTGTFGDHEDEKWIVDLTRGLMEDMELGVLSEMALLAAVERQTGVEDEFFRLRCAVYTTAYRPLLENRSPDPTRHVLPPDQRKFGPNWERAVRRAIEAENGLDLRLQNSHTWWRPTDFFLMEYVYLLFGSFDGLADILRGLLPVSVFPRQ